MKSVEHYNAELKQIKMALLTLMHKESPLKKHLPSCGLLYISSWRVSNPGLRWKLWDLSLKMPT